MSDYEFTLPWPPSVNGYWRSFRGRQIISKRGREYKETVAGLMDDLNLSDEMISDRVAVRITLCPPTLRKYDIDNFCKCVFDALSKCGFWEDDELVYALNIRKGEKIKGGLVRVIVNRMAAR